MLIKAANFPLIEPGWHNTRYRGTGADDPTIIEIALPLLSTQETILLLTKVTEIFQGPGFSMCGVNDIRISIRQIVRSEGASYVCILEVEARLREPDGVYKLEAVQLEMAAFIAACLAWREVESVSAGKSAQP